MQITPSCHVRPRGPHLLKMSDFGGSFSRPLSLFVSGKTDNEKLAALLIVRNR